MTTWEKAAEKHQRTEGQLNDTILTRRDIDFYKAHVEPEYEQFYLDRILTWANEQRAKRGLPPVDGKAEL